MFSSTQLELRNLATLSFYMDKYNFEIDNILDFDTVFISKDATRVRLRAVKRRGKKTLGLDLHCVSQRDVDKHKANMAAAEFDYNKIVVIFKQLKYLQEIRLLEIEFQH